MSVSLAILILYIIALFGISWFAKKRAKAMRKIMRWQAADYRRRLSRSRSSVWLLAGLRRSVFQSMLSGSVYLPAGILLPGQ